MTEFVAEYQQRTTIFSSSSLSSFYLIKDGHRFLELEVAEEIEGVQGLNRLHPFRPVLKIPLTNVGQNLSQLELFVCEQLRNLHIHRHHLQAPNMAVRCDEG